ncbi:MAG TPA: AmmeMemoRadiSam system radical SAM enzyme [Bacteroidales bacterium]|nr:AmmeMemoRadiSam system radical SAM enzyme [Bacteroidales bacterium]
MQRITANYLSLCIVTIILLSSSFKVLSQTSKTDSLMNRKPAVAGQFYSGTKETLTNDLIHLFAPAKERNSDAIAIISPHAGYVFSGEVAASAISQINPDKSYKNVFILASSHTTYFKGVSVYNVGNYETPLGEVKVNTDLCNELIKNNSVFSFNPEAHKSEHSIEVQLPFLQFHLKNDFQIVPIVLGSDGANNAKEIAEILKPYFNDDNIFIISTDFSHYPNYENAIKSDKLTADAICSGNPDSLINVVNKKSDIANLATPCCAWPAVLTLMYMADNNYQYNQIQYKNSGDSEYGDHNRVVGYWAISLTKKNQSSYNLSDEEKITLLKLARLTVETKVTDNKKPDISDFNFTDNLNEHCGAFVTLHKDSNLRGCIGRFEPNIPLYQVVIEMAVAAAMNDYRFSPVKKDELENIDIEISVLTPMVKIDSVEQIVLGKHGIYISKGSRGGTFLPQVATETGWTLEEFLGHCSQDKAGIGYDGWKDADIYIYEAIIFSEKEFGLYPKKKTKYYEKLDNNKVQCTLCPHTCILGEDQKGLCNSRKNINGELVSLTYGKPVSINIDPVEKKPLYHFLPGSTTLSFGTAGCNLHCKNCQNSSISQADPEKIDYIAATSEQIVNTALANECKSISYTYTEPTIFYEFMLETAKLAHEKGLKNIMVSNGYINQEPLLELIPYIDAANIDLKCFNDSIYKNITTANLQPVLNTLLTLKENGVWLEITNLVIPDYTDDMEMISEMCDWLVANGLEDVPIHFSRFHPSYKMQNVQPTPTETLQKAYSIAKEKGMKYVYLGNIQIDKTNTICPNCGETILTRSGFSTATNNFNGVCPKCGKEINGVW